jgi:hypothetical protein
MADDDDDGPQDNVPNHMIRRVVVAPSQLVRQIDLDKLQRTGSRWSIMMTHPKDFPREVTSIDSFLIHGRPDTLSISLILQDFIYFHKE